MPTISSLRPPPDQNLVCNARYVLVELAGDSLHDDELATSNTAQHSTADPPSASHVNATASALGPSVTRDMLFGARGRWRAGSATTPSAAPPSPLSIPVSQPLTLADTYARSRGLERGSYTFNSDSTGATMAAGGGSGGGEWVDKQSINNSKPAGAPPAVVSGGSLWMEAAAAKQKISAGAPGGTRTRRRGSRTGGGGGGGARGERTEYGINVNAASLSGGRQSPRRGSPSSNEDGSVLSWAADSAAEVDWGAQQLLQQQQQLSRRGGASAMAAAAEAAAISAALAAKTAAHPQAKRVLERLLAVEGVVDATIDSLELELRPMARQTRAPGSRVSVESSLSSPRGSTSPLPEQQQHQKQNWFSPSDTVANTAPRLEAAAALLIDRAWVSRHALLGSMSALRERAVGLVVAEPAATTEPIGPMSPRLHGWCAGRQQQVLPVPSPARVVGLKVDEVRHVFSGVTPEAPDEAASSVLMRDARHGTHATSGPDGVSPSLNLVGLGLSTCRDFERILGEDEMISSSVLPRDKATSVTVQPVRSASDAFFDSFAGYAKSSPQSSPTSSAYGDTDGMPREQKSGSPIATPSSGVSLSWPSILFEVEAIEERCRCFVSDWEAAAAVMADSFGEDSRYGSVGHSLSEDAVAQ